ncbi:PREDICTED: probable deoxycytidylate deaminase [Amphimedon queenslandica]|uniref:dCMP deaminase n=1 Tax=Amphimedon queenslandica TaxID=400682 RepID=A0A1X7T8Y5_AMPQE|nr:PREDICTED: probable deoxycytidylate deaminase [Amphimedon queenslandica]|eukprot:XP_019860857.1 PREDICTED: probable deoxycytidylate deaminase [Amphimedon queenslandica]
MPKDKDFTWKGASSRSEINSINPKLKYAYVVHAVVNAILNKTRESIKGCILYTTLHPDEDCAHAMIQAEMKEVVYCMYTRKDELDPDQKKAQVIFEIKKIQYRELPQNDDFKDDKYVKELQRRIEQGKKEKEDAKREPEPATAMPPEKFFMRMAKLSQKRPGDFQNKAVGACIATPNKQIVAVEYSGEPDGIQLEIERKAKELHPGLHMSNDSSFFVHAEYRAIVGRSVRGCTLYVTSYPCNVCAKVIVESGIKEVVYYKDGYCRNDDRYKSSRKILTTCLDPSNIRKYGNGGSRNEIQDEASRSIAIEGPGHTYFGKIIITDVQ